MPLTKELSDWRGGTLNMVSLVYRLHDTPEGQAFSDVTFLLSDNSVLQAHKLILATASPYFEALFFGSMTNNNDGTEQKIAMKDVESTTFRLLIKLIYRSGKGDTSKLDESKILALMEAADMYLLPKLVETLENTMLTKLSGVFPKKLAEHMDRISQLPLFAKVFKQAKKSIIRFFTKELGDDGVWEQLSQRVQADIAEDLEKITWEEDSEICCDVLHILREMAGYNAPFPELMNMCNYKLSAVIQSYGSKDSFINGMDTKLKLDKQWGDRKKVREQVKSMLDSKTWEELCEKAFSDIVKMLERDENGNANPIWEFVFSAGPRTSQRPDADWHFRSHGEKEAWKGFSRVLKFAHQNSLPRLRDHAKVLMLFAVFYPDVNAINYVMRASEDEIYRDMYKFGMLEVISDLSSYAKSEQWVELPESAILIVRENYKHFKKVKENDVIKAIRKWCAATSSDEQEAKNMFKKIWET